MNCVCFFYVLLLSLLTVKMVLMTLILAFMKVYFLSCMPNDAYECPKVLLNVDKNAKIVIESDLCIII